MGTVTTMRKAVPATQTNFNRNTKTYYLIFPEDGKSPATVTESWKAAEYWKSLGCEIEEYTRSLSPPPERH